jgi:hypothetical protein
MEAVTAVNSGTSPGELPPVPHNAAHHRDAELHINSGFWKIVSIYNWEHVYVS